MSAVGQTQATPDRPRGPQRPPTADPLRAARYRYGNTASQALYRYVQRALAWAELQRPSAGARRQLLEDLGAIGVRLRPHRLTYFCREVHRAAELWALGEINSHQARQRWKAAALDRPLGPAVP